MDAAAFRGVFPHIVPMSMALMRHFDNGNHSSVRSDRVPKTALPCRHRCGCPPASSTGFSVGETLFMSPLPELVVLPRRGTSASGRGAGSALP